MKPQFKTEWTPEDFRLMEGAIKKHLGGRVLVTHHAKHGQYFPRSFKAIADILGLAYTSSSSCAMYGICNTQLKYDEVNKYEFFAISVDGLPYAILWDKKENEAYLELFIPATYKVLKVFRNSGRRKVIERGLSREEAKRLVNSFPDSSRSMVVFCKQKDAQI